MTVTQYIARFGRRQLTFLYNVAATLPAAEADHCQRFVDALPWEHSRAA